MGYCYCSCGEHPEFFENILTLNEFKNLNYEEMKNYLKYLGNWLCFQKPKKYNYKYWMNLSQYLDSHDFLKNPVKEVVKFYKYNFKNDGTYKDMVYIIYVRRRYIERDEEAFDPDSNWYRYKEKPRTFKPEHLKCLTNSFINKIIDFD